MGGGLLTCDLSNPELWSAYCLAGHRRHPMRVVGRCLDLPGHRLDVRVICVHQHCNPERRAPLRILDVDRSVLPWRQSPIVPLCEVECAGLFATPASNTPQATEPLSA